MIKISPISFGATILILTETSYEVVARFRNIQARAWKTATNGEVHEIQLRILTLILPRSRTGTVWFYTSTSNKRAARPKLYTESLTRVLKLMYSRFTLVRISIKL